MLALMKMSAAVEKFAGKIKPTVKKMAQRTLRKDCQKVHSSLRLASCRATYMMSTTLAIALVWNEIPKMLIHRLALAPPMVRPWARVKARSPRVMNMSMPARLPKKR